VRLFAALAAVVGFAAASADAPATLPLGGAAATAKPGVAGARPATLKVALRLELRCARPSPAPIVISLPRAWRVPRAVSKPAVWIDRSHPKAVAVSGHAVTLEPRASTGSCTVMAPATLAISFTRAANLGNPRKPGRYAIYVSIGTEKFRARVAIKRP
jgi:hypothetical protein